MSPARSKRVHETRVGAGRSLPPALAYPFHEHERLRGADFLNHPFND